MSQFNEYEHSILDRVALSQFVVRALDILEMHVLQLLLEGFSVTDIAQRQHCSRRYITRVVTSLRQKARPFFSSHPEPV